MIKKDNLFHLENLEPSNLASGFQMNYELLFSDEYGYSGYASHHEPNKNPQVIYKLNRDGFRSENFEKLKSSNLNVLISGCSLTFGQGVFQENSWPELFSKKLSNNSIKPIKMYNLGVLGASIYLIIKNLMAFIRRYGSPDEIYLLLPPHSRKIIYDESFNSFKNAIINKEDFISLVHKKDLSTKKFYNSYCNEDAKLLAVTLIGIFEDFCESKNIKLIWSSYDATSETDFYETSGFKFYKKYVAPEPDFYYNDKSLSHLIPENKNNVPYWDIGSDEDHPGAVWHKDIAEMFSNFQKVLP
jgi:hypothetical protein